jgi:hypothetical protein
LTRLPLANIREEKLKLSYNWRCKVCEQVNTAGAPNCSHCGFKAVAAPVEINAYRAEHQLRLLTPDESADFDLFSELEGLPLWRKVIGYCLIPIMGLSAIGLKVLVFSITWFYALIALIVSFVAWCFVTDKSAVRRARRESENRP